VPRSTYRLQLTPTFTLADAAEVVPYLAHLGVTHVYCSPFLQAAPGSTHGYDVVDHGQVNAELGGSEGFTALCRVATAHGMQLLIDIVPNHMAVGGRENAAWWDVLRLGSDSPYASWFDIDWEAGGGRVLTPILGGRYGSELVSGNLRVEARGATAEVVYFQHRLPVSPQSEALLGDRSEATLAALNHEPAALHRFLHAQHYRLAYWRNATEELNYRRFFDVNTLAGIRVEEPEAFEESHRLPLQWVREGLVHGLRVDHPDGLRDPQAYLQRLRNESGGVWVLVEKITEPGEELPVSWACDGTTGYDFMRLATGVMVDSDSAAEMIGAYEAFTATAGPYAEIAAASKHFVLTNVLAADVSRVARLADRICRGDAHTADYAEREVRAAVEALVVAFPVYRTYATAAGATPGDAAIVAAAGREAARRDGIDPALIGVLVDALTSPAAHDPAQLEFRARFQQLTGPAMAKSIEDTAFYRYLPLVALNEVGSDPAQFGVSVDEFHTRMAAMAASWPDTMLGSSTHDTKRSEDVRARIALLAEMPGTWTAAAGSWQHGNEAKWGSTDPDRGMEYLLYQTLVGSHPLPADRAVAYMAKASREAKQRTSWLSPDVEYDVGLEAFVRSVLADHEFTANVAEFCAQLAVPGRISSLAQLVLKLTAPGVPDIYQGSELWTDSLVDPDNRRAVDYAERAVLLHSLDPDSPGGLPALAADQVGVSKLWLTARLLALRKARPLAFDGPAATYAEVQLAGRDRHIGLAYRRGDDVVAVVPVRPVHVYGMGWGDTSIVLPPGRWRNIFESGDGPAEVGLDSEIGLAGTTTRFGSAVFVRELL
jgi:(1->4)-alpha-D-glucan 1-alpha-D-glucosylmutase